MLPTLWGGGSYDSPALSASALAGRSHTQPGVRHCFRSPRTDTTGQRLPKPNVGTTLGLLLPTCSRTQWCCRGSDGGRIPVAGGLRWLPPGLDGRSRGRPTG